MEATYIYLKIFYNDKEVTKTSAFPMDPNRFVVFFNDKSERIIIDDTGRAINNQGVYVELKVSEIPESIRMEVYETGILGDSFVGEIVVPIPGPHDVISSVDKDCTELDFSGRPFSKNIKVSNDEANESWYTGKIKLLCAWAVDESGRSMGPKRR